MLITSSANVGARLTRARKSFFEIGTSATSVLAMAVALRGAEFDQRHLAENVIGLERSQQTVAELEFPPARF